MSKKLKSKIALIKSNLLIIRERFGPLSGDPYVNNLVHTIKINSILRFIDRLIQIVDPLPIVKTNNRESSGSSLAGSAYQSLLNEL